MWKTKYGRCIYTSPSGYKVYQNLIYRWLTLGSNALQTVINRRNPQRPILYYLPALSLMARKFPNDCCLLGLGGAGIAHMLSTTGHSIIAIDSSEEVIQIAKQFFMLDRIPNLIVVHQNAIDYLQTCETKYPQIIVDLYDANHFPPECNNDEFFIACKNRLSEDGFISVNLANLKEQMSIFKIIKKQFKRTIVIPIKKSANIVVIASNLKSNELFINKLRESKEIGKIVWVETWGYVGDY